YEYEDIVLERGTAGLGFSIAGGRDNPNCGSYMFETLGLCKKLFPFRADDAIMAVNNIDTSNVCHADAVNALKLAGSTVRFFFRGFCKLFSVKIDVQLVKGTKGLGFSIAGGVGNQHLPGDDGIFVTKIIEGGAAEADGLLQVGDKILSVDAVRVLNMSHETAVSILKSTANVVNLRILRQNNINSPEPADLPTKEEDVAPIILPPPSDEVQPDPFQQPPPTNAFENEIKGLEPRVVSLNKTGCGLGFNIVGGDGSEGIYISYILAGGTADVSGELYRGDQLLSVNGIDLTKATHEEAAHALKSADKTVTMVAQYKPEDYNRFEEKIQELREQMMNLSVSSGGSLLTSPENGLSNVRSLFDYDSYKDSGLPSNRSVTIHNTGLSFRYGDILHVINASDDEWWQARRVGDSEEFGVVPAKQRVERKERARLKQVKFSQLRPSLIDTKESLNQVKRKKSLMFSRRFPFYKSKENLDDLSDHENETILSYETVVQKELKYTRPVVILGPFKDRINDDLIAEYPDKFGSCVPHTTRERRENEENGRDYHFVESREKMEADIQNHFFIEAGQYNENLYGTSVQSVKDVAEKGSVFNTKGALYKRHGRLFLVLTQISNKPREQTLYPRCFWECNKKITSGWTLADCYFYPTKLVLMRRFSCSRSGNQDTGRGRLFIFMELNKRLVEEQARKIFDRAVKQEQEFGEYFTSVVQGETIGDLHENVKRVIKEQSGPVVWVPASDDI
uniref:Uncharacterized protein n=1 Tax=Ciona savignyi TaxID=51511 RepID=H2ZDM2_CIOSA